MRSSSQISAHAASFQAARIDRSAMLRIISELNSTESSNIPGCNHRTFSQRAHGYLRHVIAITALDSLGQVPCDESAYRHRPAEANPQSFHTCKRILSRVKTTRSCSFSRVAHPQRRTIRY